MNDDEIRERLGSERQRLEEAQEALVSGGEIGEPEGEAIGELSVVDQHPADIGTETFDMERDLSLLEQVRSDLDDVDAALRRLEDGSYGRCEACGEAIGDERLEAMPAARFCLVHQQVAESGGGAAAELGQP